jgi:hypothetical protein
MTTPAGSSAETSVRLAAIEGELARLGALIDHLYDQSHPVIHKPAELRAANSPMAADPAADPELRGLVRAGKLVKAAKRYQKLTDATAAEAIAAVQALGP